MILPDALERFGPLSEAVQVKGAIPLAQIARNGMHQDVDRLAGLRARLEEDLAGRVDELLREPRFEGLLRLDREGQIILTEKGQAPSLSQTRPKISPYRHRTGSSLSISRPAYARATTPRSRGRG